MIAVEADVSEEWDSSTDWPTLAERAIGAAFAHSDHAGLAESDLTIEVSVRFTSDDEVKSLNGEWRDKDKPTNVLSFPMIEPELIAAIARSGRGEVLLGDVVLAQGVCAAEAVERGITIATHATHLVVHGALHLLGYDHETGDEDAEAMEDIERRALASLGISDPYATNEVKPEHHA